MPPRARKDETTPRRNGATARAARQIAVTGDVAVDWMLVVPTDAAPSTLEKSYQWDAQQAVHVVAQPGSAPLLASVIAACAALTPPGDEPIAVAGPAVPPGALTDPGDATITRTFAVWQPYPTRLGARERSWRMHEYLGRRPAT